MIILKTLLIFVCFQAPQDIDARKNAIQRFTHTYGLLNVLTRPRLPGELEIVDSQLEQIETVKNLVRTRMMDLTKHQSDQPISQSQKFKDFNDFLDEQISFVENEVLVPHQFRALTQIYFRERIFNENKFNVQALADSIPELNINQEQRKKLDAIAAENARKVAEATKAFKLRIAKIKSESNQKLLAVLEPQQRKTFEDKLGKIIKPASESKRDE